MARAGRSSPAQFDFLTDDSAAHCPPLPNRLRGPCPLQPDPYASAFLTSDCEMPNCLAIADGLTPALKAARTAFSLPVLNKPALSSAVALRRCSFASGSGLSFAGLGGSRPRRSASAVTAVSSSSISTSSNRFSAPAKSVGKKWRCCEARLCGPALPIGTVEGPAAFTVGRAENRSGVVPEGRRFGMPQLCRRWLSAATAGSPSQHIVLAADRLLPLKWSRLTAQTISALRHMIVWLSRVFGPIANSLGASGIS
jgi:hypothetical protein